MGFRSPNTSTYVNQNRNDVAIAGRSLTAVSSRRNVRCALYCQRKNMLQKCSYEVQSVVTTDNNNHKRKPISTGERLRHTTSLKVLVGQGNE